MSPIFYELIYLNGLSCLNVDIVGIYIQILEDHKVELLFIANLYHV